MSQHEFWAPPITNVYISDGYIPSGYILDGFVTTRNGLDAEFERLDAEFENLVNITMNYATPAFKNVISADGENQLTHATYTPDNLLFPNDTCPITCTEFKEGDAVIQLPCKHAYEPESILKWLKEEKAECPTCRYKLESTEVRTVDTNTMDTNTMDTNTMDTNNVSEYYVDDYNFPLYTSGIYNMGAEPVSTHTEPVGTHTEPVIERTESEIVIDHIQSIPTQLIHFIYNFSGHTSVGEETI
jgi:hypothetical protein